MRNNLKTYTKEIAFLVLFASEFTFYLLILQTGIVEYHNSVMSEIWMVPVGGIIGIVISVFLYKERDWFIPLLLLVQLLLSLNYADSSRFELFGFGLISGLTAPILIARVKYFWVVVVALAFSYSYGTIYFDTVAEDRGGIALFLSATALLTSLFANMKEEKRHIELISIFSVGSIFLWLLLDASLFETLSRDGMMRIWGEGAFTYNIIIFHIIGLIVAYRAKDSRYNDIILLFLFIVTYTLYSFEWQLAISIVYPFVISYYNVIILRALAYLPYTLLAIMALSLWGASGLGLLIALSGEFTIAWGILLVLAIINLYKIIPIPLRTSISRSL